MIELTPLDVRKKRGDFRRAMRGFEPQEVDAFLELVAERMESLVKENMTLKERSARLADQVREQGVREKAVQDALVTAQELRKDISGQARREAELMKREAEAEIERMLLDAENRADSLESAMADLERRRLRFIKGYRHMLERELYAVEAEAGRHPLEDKPLELELAGGASALIESVNSNNAAAPPPEPAADPSQSPPPPAGAASPPPAADPSPAKPVDTSPAVPVDILAPEAPSPTLDDIPEDWGSVRPRLRTESGADTDGF